MHGSFLLCRLFSLLVDLRVSSALGACCHTTAFVVHLLCLHLLAILQIAMSTHCPCFTIACCLLTSRDFPRLISPHTNAILWLTIVHVRSSLFLSTSFHHWRFRLWFFLFLCSLASPLVNGAFLQHQHMEVCNNRVRWWFLQHQPLCGTMTRRDRWFAARPPAPLCGT